MCTRQQTFKPDVQNVGVSWISMDDTNRISLHVKPYLFESCLVGWVVYLSIVHL